MEDAIPVSGMYYEWVFPINVIKKNGVTASLHCTRGDLLRGQCPAPHPAFLRSTNGEDHSIFNTVLEIWFYSSPMYMLEKSV